MSCLGLRILIQHDEIVPAIVVLGIHASVVPCWPCACGTDGVLCVAALQAQPQAAPPGAHASTLEQLAALLRSNLLMSPMYARALQQQLALLQEQQARGAAAHSNAAAAQQPHAAMNGAAPALQQQQEPVIGAAQNGHGTLAAACGQLQQAVPAPQANGCVQLCCMCLGL